MTMTASQHLLGAYRCQAPCLSVFSITSFGPHKTSVKPVLWFCIHFAHEETEFTCPRSPASKRAPFPQECLALKPPALALRPCPSPRRLSTHLPAHRVQTMNLQCCPSSFARHGLQGACVGATSRLAGPLVTPNKSVSKQQLHVVFVVRNT